MKEEAKSSGGSGRTSDLLVGDGFLYNLAESRTGFPVVICRERSRFR